MILSTWWNSSEALQDTWPMLAAVVCASLLFFLFGNRVLVSIMKARLQRLETVREFNAVPTSSPYGDPANRARVDARKSIVTRYSVIRLMLAGLLLVVVVVSFLLPLLTAIPQALMSFLLAIVVAVVGVAARPLVENLIAGAVLSLSNQLRIGDTVLIDDQYGTVEDIHATHTVIKLWDWRRYLVPNSAMLTKELVHLTHKDEFLWAHVEFHVSRRANLAEVEGLAIAAAKGSKYFAGFEEPQFWVKDFTPQSTVCWLAAWARTPENAWYLRADIRRGLADGFRELGIDTQLHSVSLQGRDARPRPAPPA